MRRASISAMFILLVLAMCALPAPTQAQQTVFVINPAQTLSTDAPLVSLAAVTESPPLNTLTAIQGDNIRDSYNENRAIDYRARVLAANPEAYGFAVITTTARTARDWVIQRAGFAKAMDRMMVVQTAAAKLHRQAA